MASKAKEKKKPPSTAPQPAAPPPAGPPPAEPPPAGPPPTDPPPQAHTKKHHHPKLSRAERKRLRLLEAIALQKKLMKEQLLREIAMTKKNESRGREEWEDLCKEIKIKEFRDELKHWGKETQVLMQAKDEKINRLMKNIDETHEMHERNFVNHLNQLDYLSDCHKMLRQSATNVFETQAQQMIQRYFEELDKTLALQARINLHTENIIHSSNIVAKDQLKKNYETYMIRKFNGVCHEIEKRYKLRDRTVKYMRKLQDNLLLWIKQLEGDMVDLQKTERYLYFMRRQQNYVKESIKLNEDEKQSRKIISDLEQELFETETDSNRQISSLKLEHEYFLNVRSTIKGSITRNNQRIHEKMLLDASESYRVINRLKEIVKNGELLLGVAACCRKYKTEREKTMSLNPNNIYPVDDEEFKFQMSVNLQQLLDISTEELTGELASIKHFWGGCSNVRFHNLMLLSDKQQLEEENAEFRNKFRSLHKSDDVAYIMEALQINPVLT